MTFIEEAINNNIEDLVDIDNRCVEPTDKAANDLTVAFAQDGGEVVEIMFTDLPFCFIERFHADMIRVFAGEFTPQDFFTRYQAHYDTLKEWVVEDSSSKIWNTAVDVFNIPPVDMYEYNGVRREDF